MGSELIAGWLPALLALAIGVAVGFAFARARRPDGAAPAGDPSAAEPPAAPESRDPGPGGEPERDPGEGGRSAELPAPALAEGFGDPSVPANAAEDPKLLAIGEEIRATRALMEESEEEVRAFGEEIDRLDAAIRRVNARLRALLREIKKRALGD